MPGQLRSRHGGVPRDAGQCDVAETCDGAGACPVDVYEIAGTVCGDGTDTVCNAADSCDAGGSCQDNFVAATVECRGDAGQCDVAETCDGAGACPVDVYEIAGTVCGDGTDTVCNAADSCDAGGSCQDNFVAATVECRGDAGQCDVAETCDGAGACPVDVYEIAGTVCGDGTDTVCNAADSCDAGGSCQDNFVAATVECRGDAGQCDVAETCDGAGACPVMPSSSRAPVAVIREISAPTRIHVLLGILYRRRLGVGGQRLQRRGPRDFQRPVQRGGCEGSGSAPVPAASLPIRVVLVLALLGSGMLVRRAQSVRRPRKP